MSSVQKNSPYQYTDLQTRSIPKSMKLIYSLFMAILIPAYWINYGPANFLWISDVTLILAYLGVMFENRVFASMAAVGGFILESFWTVAFLLALVFDIHFTSIADYMFNPQLALWLRLLSLFHIVLPFLVIWLVRRLGYFKPAVAIQTILLLIVLTVCWSCTDPSKNINWVFSYHGLNVDPWVYLISESLVIASLLFITHLFLCKISKSDLALKKLFQ